MLTTITRRGQLGKFAATAGRLQAPLTILAGWLFFTGCGPPGPDALHRGDRMLQDGQYEDAIPVLKDATQLLTHYSPVVQAHAWNLLGLANQNAGHAGPAAQAYQEALKLDRNLAAADYNFGCLQLQQSNYPAAVYALTTYTALRGSDPQGFLRLGEALSHYAMLCGPRERRDVFGSARSALAAAEKLAPTAQTANAIGLLDLQERPGSPTPESVRSAIKQFQVAMVRQTNYPPALLNLAIVDQVYLRDPQSALDRYHQYLALQPLPENAPSVEKIARALEIEQRIQIVPHNGERPSPPAPANSNQAGSFSAPVRPAPVTFVATPTPPPASAPKPSPPPPQLQRPPPTAAATTSSVASTPPERLTTPQERNVARESPSPPPTPSRRAESPPETARTENQNPSPTKPPPASETTENKPSFQSPPTPPPTPVALHAPALAPSPASNEIHPLSEPAPAASSPANPPSVSLDAGSPDENQPRPKSTFFDKLNPRNWFASRPPPSQRENPVESTAPPPEEGNRRYIPPLPITPIPGNRAAAQQWVQQGAEAQRAGRLTEAMADYQKAVETDSTDAQAEVALGLACIDAKDYDHALTWLDRALDLQSDSTDARYAFAWVLQKQNYFQDAAVQLEKLLAQHPDQVRAHLLLGNIYAQRLGQTRLAREQYMTVLSLDPDNSQAATIRNWLAKTP